MNLEEFRKALSSDATEENAQLKRQLSDLQTEYHEKLSKLENENDSLKESCRVLCNVWMTPFDVLRCTIEMLNAYRENYLETKDKQDWWQMIQLLPSSYNQRRTVMLNYEVLANIYKSRRNHKLDEWHTFCDWIESLPYSELITGKEEKADV